MKSLLLAVLLLGLVAVLKAQEAPLDDQEDVRMGGAVGGGRRWPGLVVVGLLVQVVSLKTEV